VPVEVVVSPGETDTVVVDVRGGDAVPLVDHDELSFTCTPSPD
jgi:hypothetical protein